MEWAIHLAMPGEDPLRVIARAQLFEDHLSSKLECPVYLKKATVDKG